MTFKVYKNRKTRHPSISIKSGDKSSWHNLEVTHSPRKNDRYIEIDSLNPNDKNKSFVRKYYRKDKHKLKGFRYVNYHLSKKSELDIKNYLKIAIKKDDVNLINQFASPFRTNIITIIKPHSFVRVIKIVANIEIFDY